MGWLTKTAFGAVRGSVRGAGRVLSRHVVPDTLIPSWQTQRAFSRAVSTTSRGISKLARKTSKSKPKPKRPGLLSRTWSREVRPAFQAVAAYKFGAVPSMTKEPKYHAGTAHMPAFQPVQYANPKRAALQSGPRSVRAASTKAAPRSTRPAPIVRAAVPAEKKFGHGEKNAWDQGRGFSVPSEWDEPASVISYPKRGPTASKRSREGASRSRLARNRNATQTARRTSVRRNLWTDDHFLVQRAKNSRAQAAPPAPARRAMWYDFD